MLSKLVRGHWDLSFIVKVPDIFRPPEHAGSLRCCRRLLRPLAYSWTRMKGRYDKSVSLLVSILYSFMEMKILPFANDFQVNIAADAVSSRRVKDYDISLSRMRQYGADVTTTEAILFELLNVCGTDVFKQVSKIVKWYT